MISPQFFTIIQNESTISGSRITLVRFSPNFLQRKVENPRVGAYLCAMTEQTLYQLGTNLAALRGNLDQITNLHAYRYRYFVDGSPLGLDCKYAQATKLAFEREQECAKIVVLLGQIQKQIVELQNEIKDPE